MQLFKLARSIRYTRRAQLTARLAKIVRRFLLDQVGPSRTRVELAGPLPQLRESPPKRLFAPRTDRVHRIDGEPRARVLAESLPLTAPIDWRPSGWNELLWMHLHYMEFLEALGDDEFARCTLDWIERNPPGANGAWRIGWNSFVTSLRTVVWMQQLAERRDRLPREVIGRLHTSLAMQLRFLERNLELDLGGNHVVKNARALLWAGGYFEGPEAARWSRIGEALLAWALREQILDDGVHFERSPSYHAQVFGDLLECASAMDAGALRTRLMNQLGSMARAVADLTHPDGLPSLFNDGGLHMAYGARELLEVWQRAGGRAPEPRELFAFEAAGYYGVRSGESFLLADCGAIAPDHLPAHGHGDILAFEWTVAGRRIVVDAGVFEYERGARRDASRASASHNTVTLDDLDQCEFWAAFRVGRRARVERRRYEELADGFVLEGAHDGYAHLAGSPQHVRTFTARAEQLTIADRVEGGAGQRVRARLLLHPDVRVERAGSSVRLTSGDVAVELACDCALSIVDAQWCPDFGVSLPTRQIVLEYPPAPCSMSFRLARVPATSNADEPRAPLPGSAVEGAIAA